MRTITSSANPMVKLAMSLAKSSRERKLRGLTLLSGVHLVQSYRQHVGQGQVTLVGEDALERNEVKLLLSGVRDLIVVKQSVFTELSGLMQGGDIVEIVKTPTVAMPDSITMDCLVLERIQDPGNLGSILRTAAAAGVRWIINLEGSVFAWSPKVLRAGMGAHFALNIVEGVTWIEVRRALRTPVKATSLTGQPLYGENLQEPACWVFGNEGAGVTDEILQQANTRLKIDQTDLVESLNVAASAAICLFEQRRQRLAANRPAG